MYSTLLYPNGHKYTGIAISTIPMATIVPQAGPNAPNPLAPLTRAGIPHRPPSPLSSLSRPRLYLFN